ncbi:hypothetical protein KR51_00034340 [Rubidibacter lacunae KORDI 51-2]|uniref:Uncharacterized protein n=1 Tax=Rubidibacter lacunae KORDI 51-2 TaxID=582515 RepID=U5DHR4_9CHRO|nr:hypothetical protein KR51_00034340 [Rubidibacter lacunae KORDI 51-2]
MVVADDSRYSSAAILRWFCSWFGGGLFFRASRPTAIAPSLLVEAQDGHEGFLRNVDGPDRLHALLTFGLFLK